MSFKGHVVTWGVTTPPSGVWAASREASGGVSGLYTLPQIYSSGQVIWLARKRDLFFQPLILLDIYFFILLTLISLPPPNVKSAEVLFAHRGISLFTLRLDVRNSLLL